MSDDSSNRTDVSTIHLDNISLQNREQLEESNLKFLGFDLSTQQLKAIVIDDKLRVCHSVAVEFDQELAEYKTRNGAHKADDGSNTVTAPVNMWLKALDLCLDKLKLDGLDFSSLLAVSGCAQQHGSVWWRRESGQLLANLNPNEYLHKELLSAFTLRDAPIWMDSSTSHECKLLERHLGGAKRMAEITGSRAYERFTGAQVAKVLRQRREVYLVTERITLISNFLASLLSGSYAPLDACDASGMNMMELRSKRWSDECLRAILRVGIGDTGDTGGQNNANEGNAQSQLEATPEVAAAANQLTSSQANDLEFEAQLERELAALRKRLGCSESLADDDNIVDSHEVIGRISRYFVERYGFPPECLVSAFTGDNPASMAGLCVGHDELILSLGTSDTAFFWLDQPKPQLNGHVLRNPLDESKFMGLICFKNGSKTRERIRDLYAHGDWQEFERLLNSVPRGNFGNLAYLYDLREIYPLIQGDFRFNKLNQRVDSFSSPELEVRACLEGQFMRLRHHSQALGLQMDQIRRVLVTGGASANKSILQVAADVFQRPVYVLESVANSACLGAAYLAKYAYELEQHKLDQSFAHHHHQSLPAQVEVEVEDLGFATSVTQPSQVTGGQPSQGGGGGGIEQALADLALAKEAGDQSCAGGGGGGGQSERPIDFSEMVLGNGDHRELQLVRAAEPTPFGASNGDVYKSLLERYVQLEQEIAQNNEQLE